jgi:hypothetical protein
MRAISMSDRVTLGNWGLGSLYLCAPTKYINYAKAIYRGLMPICAPALPTHRQVAEGLRDQLLLDIDFQNTLTKRDPYLNVRNNGQNTIFYGLADLLARYIVSRDWAKIV